MKYAASITIVDDQGNVAFERELTHDETLGFVLDAFANQATPASVTPPPRPYRSAGRR